MKTPRVKDFDPDAKVPSLKSSLENMPAIGKHQDNASLDNSNQNQSNNTQLIQPNQHIPERPNVLTPVRPNGKRIVTRNSFEVYEDQMDALRKLSYKEKMEGKLGSMSNMVREAIDNYLQKRASEK